MGYKKVRENKRAKSSSVQKERERKEAMPSQKEAREGKLLKGVHQIYHTHAHLDQLV